MKFLGKLLIFYTIHLLSCSFIFAQPEACRFFDSGIEGVEVGQIGDRQIYTLFTRHLLNESDEIRWIVRSFERLEAVFHLNSLIDRHRATIASEQSDARKIKQLVELGKVDWIGIEEYPKTGITDTDRSRNLYFIRLGDFISWNRLPEWDSNKTDQLLFLIHDAFTITRANYPGIFYGLQIYPLEHEGLMVESISYFHEMFYRESLIKKDPHVTRDQVLEISSFMDNTITPDSHLSEQEFENFLDELGILEESRINLRVFMQAYIGVVSLLSERDAAIVQSILDIPGNGLILFGGDHGPGIKAGLIEACQNGNGSPR